MAQQGLSIVTLSLSEAGEESLRCMVRCFVRLGRTQHDIT